MQDTAPALYQHCCLIYTAMDQLAKDVEREGQTVRVYEGFLTRLFEKNRLATPYYTSVMAELQRMDCVRQLRRGGGSSPSEWMLLQAPSPTLWEMKSSRPRGKRKNRRAEANDEYMQRLNDLKRQVDWLYEYTGTPRPAA